MRDKFTKDPSYVICIIRVDNCCNDRLDSFESIDFHNIILLIMKVN